MFRVGRKFLFLAFILTVDNTEDLKNLKLNLFPALLSAIASMGHCSKHH